MNRNGGYDESMSGSSIDADSQWEAKNVAKYLTRLREAGYGPLADNMQADSLVNDPYSSVR
jgi:hypothetical protein